MIPGLGVSVSWLVFITYWAFTARAAKRSAVQVTPRWWLAERGSIVVVLLLSWPLGFYPLSPFPRDGATDALGAALCILGVAFAVWARRHLGKNWSAVPSLKQDHELVTSGPYRFVRHPIYTGMLIAYVGTAIVSGLAWWIVFALCSLFVVRRVRIEEHLMETAFPTEYAAYRRHTRALIPMVW